jgi:hypothetical protein
MTDPTIPGYIAPVVNRVSTGGCNFCTRGVTTDESAYPVQEVKRAINGGLLVRICDECRKHIGKCNPTRSLP